MESAWTSHICSPTLAIVISASVKTDRDARIDDMIWIMSSMPNKKETGGTILSWKQLFAQVASIKQVRAY